MAADGRRPAQIIEDMVTERRWVLDEEVLAELETLPALADEGDPCWDDRAYWEQVAFRYVALSGVAAERRIRAAIPLILDRACLGDPGELMRGLCHALEAIVRPDWGALTEPCVSALASPRAGTRFWAANQLARVRDPRAIPALERLSHDQVEAVRMKAIRALERTRG